MLSFSEFDTPTLMLERYARELVSFFERDTLNELSLALSNTVHIDIQNSEFVEATDKPYRYVVIGISVYEYLIIDTFANLVIKKGNVIDYTTHEDCLEIINTYKKKWFVVNTVLNLEKQRDRRLNRKITPTATPEPQHHLNSAQCPMLGVFEHQIALCMKVFRKIEREEPLDREDLQVVDKLARNFSVLRTTLKQDQVCTTDRQNFIMLGIIK